ncbi:PD40 domain-containing protein [bacterium]|nr:PD40 domain-containing protein [candidate division CSSED10-310 bacterium]
MNRAMLFVLFLLLMTATAGVFQATAGSLAVHEIHQVTRSGEYTAPRFSPDGSRLAAAGPGYGEVVLLEETAALRVLMSAPGVGYGFLWLPDSSGLVFRTRVNGRSLVRRLDLDGRLRECGEIMDSCLPARYKDTVFFIDPAGEPHIIMGNLPPEALVFVTVKNDVIVLHKGQAARRISPDGDRFFLPVLSPDGSHVLFEGMTTGIWTYRIADNRLVNIGQGNHPSWAPDGFFVYFDVEEDDGERVTAAELWRATPDGTVRECLTATPAVIEMRPAAAPDGGRIAYDAGGSIFLAELEEQP